MSGPNSTSNMSLFQLTPSTRLVISRGDITRVVADAIVNAANKRCLGGGGVDGCIHRAAGRELVQACRQLPLDDDGNRCPTGEARITPGFRLPATHVIHTVGPIYRSPEHSAPLLTAAYRSSLQLARENGLKTIAFPALSCGVYSYPYNEAAEIALKTCQAEAGDLERIQFVLFDRDVFEVFHDAAEQAFERIPNEPQQEAAQGAPVQDGVPQQEGEEPPAAEPAAPEGEPAAELANEEAAKDAQKAEGPDDKQPEPEAPRQEAAGDEGAEPDANAAAASDSEWVVVDAAKAGSPMADGPGAASDGAADEDMPSPNKGKKRKSVEL